MTHKQEKFQFAGNEGKVIELISNPYTFEMEHYLIEMIGKDKFNEYQKSSSVDLELNLDNICTFFPKLLSCEDKDFKFSDIIWAKQDYDSILSVVSFFLGYKKNANLRLLNRQKETIALTIEMMKKILSLSPEDLSNKEKLGSILDSLSQEAQASSTL